MTEMKLTISLKEIEAVYHITFYTILQLLRWHNTSLR